jgi:hypothetical protein
MGISKAFKVLGVSTGIAFICWMFSNRSEREAPAAPGWDGLISCAYSTSLDGTKRLSVSENSHATLYEEHEPLDRKQGDEIPPIEGTWSFDESSKRYLVVLNGETTTYVLVNPEGGGMCMLIAGEVEAANLRRSWFSAPNDDNGSGDQGPGPYDR